MIYFFILIDKIQFLIIFVLCFGKQTAQYFNQTVFVFLKSCSQESTD